MSYQREKKSVNFRCAEGANRVRPLNPLKMFRRFGTRGLVAALLCSSGAVAAQDLSSAVVVSQSVTASSDISPSNLPATGVSGQSGRAGYYTCNEMSWGAACAKFYGFGSYTIHGATNGGAAPSSGTVTNVSSSDSSIVSVYDYDPSTVSNTGFTV